MEIILLAIALSMDSAALSIANGAKCGNLNLFKISKIAFIYGFFQALLLFIGYLLGFKFVSYVKFIDHYIAFFILLFLGLKMIRESKANLECSMDLSFKLLIMGAIATSIDALAVGVALGISGISVLFSSIIVGLVCFGICVGAVYIGKYLGDALEKKAFILGGVILIIIGFKILLTHIFYLDA